MKVECTTYLTANENFDSKYFRIPFCEVTNHNVLIAGGDIRYNGSSDVDNIDIGIRRSLDLGNTFLEEQKVLCNHRSVEKSRILDACILVDRQTNRVFIFGHNVDSNALWEHTKEPSAIEAYMVYTYSDDDGATWAPKRSLAHLKDETMVSFFPAPGKGIQMEDGTLVVPCQIKTNEQEVPSIQSCIMISEDGGNTWAFPGGRVEAFSSECQVVELDSGILMLNCRSYASYRRVYLSYDKGKTWVPHETDSHVLVEPYACQGSFDKITVDGQPLYVFVNPNSKEKREKITLKVSKDTINWQEHVMLVEEETDGYTCICHLDHLLFIAVERRGNIELYKVEMNCYKS